MAYFDRRAVQLDLARQIEPVSTVLRFFDKAHDAGMNMVFLYLEDRIKTATYPYGDDAESYTTDQIREMVAYAENLGLELVPVVSPVGHTERFLKHPELKHIAELRGKIAGAYNEAGVERYMATCPQLPATHEFFDAYLREVAELFPSPFFHIGFDEIWDMGFCELCKNKPIADLYYEAVTHFHDVLKSCGKDCMIWDDMLEQFPWVLEKLPRDIIPCAWFYQFTERYPVARFSTGRSYDLFGRFEQLGFRYFACCWRNNSVDSLTAYAAKNHPFGMLMTNWEMSDERTLPMLYPQLYQAGAVWSGKAPIGIDNLREATARFADTPAAADALALVFSNQWGEAGYRIPGEKAAYYLPDEPAYTDRAIVNIIRNALQTATGDEEVLDAFRAHIERKYVVMRLWETGYALHEYRCGEGVYSVEQLREQAAQRVKDVERYRELARRVWERTRKGLASPALDGVVDTLAKSAQFLVDTAATATDHDCGRLVVRFDLPEFCSSCTTTITVGYADGSTYQAACGNYKAVHVRAIEKYDYSFTIPADKVPTSVTLMIKGYGAAGVRYVSATLPGGRHYLPIGLTDVHGQIDHPEALLYDDSRTAVFNEPEMQQFFVNHITRHRENTVTLSLG